MSFKPHAWLEREEDPMPENVGDKSYLQPPPQVKTAKTIFLLLRCGRTVCRAQMGFLPHQAGGPEDARVPQSPTPHIWFCTFCSNFYSPPKRGLACEVVLTAELQGPW